MRINLKSAVRLSNLLRKDVGTSSIVGKILSVRGNIAEIVANNKFYIIALNNPTVLKDNSVVELIFSNRQVTTPEPSGKFDRKEKRYIEAKLLFESDVDDAKANQDSNTISKKVVSNYPKISSILRFIFSKESTVDAISSLQPRQLEILLEDLKRIAETINDSKLEEFKKDLTEFLVRVRKKLPRFLSFPKEVRALILKIYTGLDKKVDQKNRTNVERHVAKESKDHPNNKIRVTMNSLKTNRNKGKIEKTTVSNFQRKYQDENVEKTKNDLNQKDDTQSVKNPRYEHHFEKLKESKNDSLNVDQKNTGQRFLSSLKSSESTSQIVKLPGEVKLKRVPTRHLENYKNPNSILSYSKSAGTQAIQRAKEIEILTKILKFSLASSTRSKNNTFIKENTSNETSFFEKRPANMVNTESTNLDVDTLPKKMSSNIDDTFLHVQSNQPRENQSPNLLPEIPENSKTLEDKLKNDRLVEQVSSQKEIFERLRMEFSEYLNKEDVDKIFTLFKRSIVEFKRVIKRLQFPLRTETEIIVLRDSLENLIDEITKKLEGKEENIEKIKNLLHKLTDELTSPHVNKESGLIEKLDEKRMFYSKIIDNLNEFVGMRSIFLKIDNMYSRIDIIDKKVDPKIKNGFRLIFDLHFENLGEVVLDTLINFKKVDLRLFVREDMKKIFQENYEAFKKLFEEEGYVLQSFLIMRSSESQTLKDERYLLLTRTKGSFNWIA